MTPREQLLQQLWSDINAAMEERWIDGCIRHSEQHPDAPFADTGAALQRLLALGADRRDLALLWRQASYETAFGTLYLMGDTGIDLADFRGLHESILSADPSGLEGRPGSAPRKKLDPLLELERTLSEAGIQVRVLDVYPSASKVRLYGEPPQLESARLYFAAQHPPMTVITTLGAKWQAILGSQPPEENG